MVSEKKIIKLPVPSKKGSFSLEEVLLKRRSFREYKKEKLTLFEISQILWAGQGINENTDLRTCPSAGALYPLELYLVAGEIKELETGFYHYQIKNHSLAKIDNDDKREKLSNACFGQKWIKEAPALILIGADFERTTKKYGQRGVRYVFLEAGHCAQNIYLQATGFCLGTVAVGAFDDKEIIRLLNLETNIKPIYLMPIGKI